MSYRTYRTDVVFLVVTETQVFAERPAPAFTFQKPTLQMHTGIWEFPQRVWKDQLTSIKGASYVETKDYIVLHVYVHGLVSSAL